MILEGQSKNEEEYFYIESQFVFPSFSWSEYSVLIVFILMVVFWLTQEFGDTRGWGVIFPDEYLEYSIA